MDWAGNGLGWARHVLVMSCSATFWAVNGFGMGSAGDWLGCAWDFLCIPGTGLGMLSVWGVLGMGSAEHGLD
jgi:hypothetical protein